MRQVLRQVPVREAESNTGTVQGDASDVVKARAGARRHRSKPSKSVVASDPRLFAKTELQVTKEANWAAYVGRRASSATVSRD